MRFAVKYIPLFISVFLFSSCGVKNNPVSVQPTQNPAEKASFVVDNVQYNIVSKKQSDGSYSDYLQYNITYHFENTSGSLNNFGIEPDGAGSYIMVGDGSKSVPANKTISLQDEYSLGKQFTPGQTVNINLSMTGSFWKNNGGASAPSGSFDVNKQLKLKVG